MLDINKIPFLATLEVTYRLRRYSKMGKSKAGRSVVIKYWDAFLHFGPKPVDVVFLGYRTVSEGYTERGMYADEGNYYVPQSYKRVALVIKDGHTNPFYVDLKHITFVNGAAVDYGN